MRPRVHLLPIEPFEERYTEQWYRWWPNGLRKAGFIVTVIPGEPVGERKGGEFLSPTQTWVWKGSQVSNLARYWGEIQDGDWILSLDGWGPSSTAAAYMRDTTGRDVRIALFLHAGSYDPHDFLARCGCRYWATHVERGWVNSADLILVGSYFHKRMLSDNLGLAHAPIAVTGIPMFQDELVELGSPRPWERRSRLVVFPHRFAPEKQPELFWKLKAIHQRLYPDSHKTTEWVRTRDAYSGKAGYYQWLGRARCAVSTALQETFGIAMQEAAALGAWLVAPNRLSYPELIGESGELYDDLEGAAVLVERALNKVGPAPWNKHHEKAIIRAAHAILTRS